MRYGSGHEAECGIGEEIYDAADDDTVMKWEPSYMVVGRQVGDTSKLYRGEPTAYKRVRGPMRGVRGHPLRVRGMR